MAKVLLAIGAILMCCGLLLYWYPAAFSWFGRLPGDIRIEGERSAFYFPLTSMIVISLLASILLHLLFRK